MFVLNRLRGTWSWMAKVNGLVLGLVFYLFTSDIYVSIALVFAYILGESFGWGKWIGGVHGEYKLPADQQMIDDEEGRNNGIHFLANALIPETLDYYRYSFVALAIRGFYWFSITFLPLLLGGYLHISDYTLISILLGIGFPLSVKIGTRSDERFNIMYINGYWEHAEVWYGFMQDMAIIAIAVGMMRV